MVVVFFYYVHVTLGSIHCFRMKSRISDSMVTRMKALGIREPVKGSLHVIVQRGFVDYVLHNETSWALRGILKTARTYGSISF